MTTVRAVTPQFNANIIVCHWTPQFDNLLDELTPNNAFNYCCSRSEKSVKLKFGVCFHIEAGGVKSVTLMELNLRGTRFLSREAKSQTCQS